jgi:hypothetical protein
MQLGHKKPLELYLATLLLVAAGTIGLINTLLAGNASDQGLMLLSIAYGLLPLAAYALFSALRYALVLARALTCITLVLSFLLYPSLNPLLFLVNAVMQSYTFLALYRHELKTIYGED